jgi:hypothetical protein
MTELWFSDPNYFGGMFGGIVGGVGGAMGGLLGAMAGFLAPRGKGKSFILGAMWVFIFLGAGFLVTGIAALVQDQPYAITYPILLVGVIFMVVMGSLVPVVRKQYAVAEKRRLEAEEFRQS